MPTKTKSLSKYTQIRINKTPQLELILANMKSKYSLFDENEIIKLLINSGYQKYTPNNTIDYTDISNSDLTLHNLKSMNNDEPDEDNLVNVDNTKPINWK